MVGPVLVIWTVGWLNQYRFMNHRVVGLAWLYELKGGRTDKGFMDYRVVGLVLVIWTKWW